MNSVINRWAQRARDAEASPIGIEPGVLQLIAQRMSRPFPWLSGNVVGIALWLWAASALWPVLREEHCEFSQADTLYLFFMLVPLFVIGVLPSLIAVVTVLIKIGVAAWQRTPVTETRVILFLATLVLWFGAAELHYHRSFRSIDFNLCPQHDLPVEPSNAPVVQQPVVQQYG
jgi:hypothetical protein